MTAGTTPLLSLVRQLEDDAVQVHDLQVFGLVVDICSAARELGQRDAVTAEVLTMGVGVVRATSQVLGRLLAIRQDVAVTRHVGEQAMTPAELAVAHLATLARCARSLVDAAAVADARALAALGEEIEARFGRGFEPPASELARLVAAVPPSWRVPAWWAPRAAAAAVCLLVVLPVTVRACSPAAAPVRVLSARVVSTATASPSPLPGPAPVPAPPVAAGPAVEATPAPQPGVLDRLLAWLRGLVARIVTGVVSPS